MKRAVEFYSEGFKLQGDVYTPDDLAPGEQRAAVLLCHGYTGVKDLYLPDNARVLNEAGYVAMAFDYKGWGQSEGVSPLRLAPHSRVSDVQAAMTFLGEQPEVDENRIGIYGTSYGGATVCWTAAIDQRAKCVVSVVGIGHGARWMSRVRRHGRVVRPAEPLQGRPHPARHDRQIRYGRARRNPAARPPVGRSGRRAAGQ